MTPPSDLPWWARWFRRSGRAKSPPARRLYLCTGPNCCTREEGLAAWCHLERRLGEAGLGAQIRAQRAECFNVCGDGPVGVVFPGPTWYGRLNPRRLDRVIEAHLIGGRPVVSLAFTPPADVRSPEPSAPEA